MSQKSQVVTGGSHLLDWKDFTTTHKTVESLKISFSVKPALERDNKNKKKNYTPAQGYSTESYYFKTISLPGNFSKR